MAVKKKVFIVCDKKGKSMDLNHFAMLGISHEKLSLKERESFLRNKPKHILESLFQENKIEAYIDLSTCLRVEFYIHLKEDATISELQQQFSFQKDLQIKLGEEALLYLCQVVCGFFSVIKGEDQILTQTKLAYQKALEEEHSSKLCNILFHKAIELGKRFRSKSEICHNALSLEAITLKAIREIFPNWKDKKILLLGIGDLSQSILELLSKEKLEKVYVTNRSFHKAERLSNFYDVNVIDFRDKYEWVGKTDIIISATSAPHTVIEKNRFLEYKLEKEYLFLDLAVPRDIDESIGTLPNVKIFNLDYLWKVSKKHSCFRQQLLEKYSYLIDEQLQNIHNTLSYYQKGVML